MNNSYEDPFIKNLDSNSLPNNSNSNIIDNNSNNNNISTRKSMILSFGTKSKPMLRIPSKTMKTMHRSTGSTNGTVTNDSIITDNAFLGYRIHPMLLKVFHATLLFLRKIINNYQNHQITSNDENMTVTSTSTSNVTVRTNNTNLKSNSNSKINSELNTNTNTNTESMNATKVMRLRRPFTKDTRNDIYESIFDKTTEIRKNILSDPLLMVAMGEYITLVSYYALN